jgi:hypothetical protein
MKNLTFEEASKQLTAGGCMVKNTYQGHGGAWAILWFDKTGYSVSSTFPNSTSTSGVLTWDEAKKYFLDRVAQALYYGG